MKLRRQLLRVLGYSAAIGICIVLLVFVVGVTWIGFDVKTQCQQAQSEYGGDCVEALLGVVQDEHRGFRVRNYAIWALGHTMEWSTRTDLRHWAEDLMQRALAHAHEIKSLRARGFMSLGLAALLATHPDDRTASALLAECIADLRAQVAAQHLRRRIAGKEARQDEHGMAVAARRGQQQRRKRQRRAVFLKGARLGEHEQKRRRL